METDNFPLQNEPKKVSLQNKLRTNIKILWKSVKKNEMPMSTSLFFWRVTTDVVLYSGVV